VGDKKNTIMMLPKLLWVSFLSGSEQPELRAAASRTFQIVDCPDTSLIDDIVLTLAPAVLCFDFDFPMETQLGVMQSVKRRHSSIPVLMLTVEHSEALAVWSFRARVWNYLVKPVAEQEWRANLQVLSRLASVGPRQRREVRLPGPAFAPIAEATRKTTAQIAIAPALQFIEKHFHESISGEHLAGLCGMSTFRFSREFRLAMNNTFRDYLLRYRVAKACKLLSGSNGTQIADVGHATGFQDGSYFARVFKRYMNVKPSEFARSVLPHEGDVVPPPSDYGLPSQVVAYAVADVPPIDSWRSR
jgi:AraC-like DNA-binding protein